MIVRQLIILAAYNLFLSFVSLSVNNLDDSELLGV